MNIFFLHFFNEKVGIVGGFEEKVRKSRIKPKKVGKVWKSIGTVESLHLACLAYPDTGIEDAHRRL